MLRVLILVLLGLSLAFLALPFVMTSRALNEHGIIIEGKVYHKSEYAKVTYSGWELVREITIEYTVPETSSVSFFTVQPDIPQYDSLRTGQPVKVRYLPRKNVPDTPGAKLLWELHALTTVSLEGIQGVSRLAVLKTPGAVLFLEILGGVILILIFWRLTRWRPFAWAAGMGALVLFALILLQGFPRPTPAPSAEVRNAAGHVTNVGRIDKLFSGSHTRGVVAEQAVDVVSVEFVPEGRTEPVMAVDLIDRGSMPGLKEKSAVTLKYEIASPRTAYIEGATRRFPERNLSGAIVTGALVLGVMAVILGACHFLGKGYNRLVSRDRPRV